MEISKKSKRKARVLSLQVLYSYEQNQDKALVTVFESVSNIPEAELASNDARKFARQLCSDTIDKLSEIDALLSKHTANWDLERLAAIDRAILRVAVAELLGTYMTPLPVVINEAVEIAKLYGTDDSAKFINGVLDALKTDIDYVE